MRDLIVLEVMAVVKMVMLVMVMVVIVAYDSNNGEDNEKRIPGSSIGS